MRITGGIHRSRKLETPKNDLVRPTSDKVRQAVFNMLHSRDVIEESIVIDAFCGTGALGLEALSQGAVFCTFFDKSKSSIELCKANVASLKETERSKIFIQDVTKLKQKPEELRAATLVFLDPPYHQNLIPKAIEAFYQFGWLTPDCFFVMEMAKDEIPDGAQVKIVQEKIYGDTKILLGNLSV